MMIRQRLRGQAVFIGWISVSLVSIVGVALYMGRGKPEASQAAKAALAREEADEAAAAGGQHDAPALTDTPMGVSHELTIEDLQVGKGAMADHGKTLTVHYLARLDDGTIIDDSHKNLKPFVFILGEGKVIAGWDKGLTGMKVGGKRKIVAPPELAYGKRGISGLVPPQASLSFEIELLAVE